MQKKVNEFDLCKCMNSVLTSARWYVVRPSTTVQTHEVFCAAKCISGAAGVCYLFARFVLSFQRLQTALTRYARSVARGSLSCA